MTRKIIFYTTNDLTHDRRMHRICRALTAAGYHTVLVGRTFKHSKDIDHLDHHRFSCLFNRGMLFYAEINLRIFLHVVVNKAEVVCSVDTDTLMGVVAGGLLRGRMIAHDAHEWYTEVPELTGKIWKKRIWSFIARLSIPRTHLRYTVNRSLATIFQERWHLPFHVIRNVPVPGATDRTIDRDLPENPEIIYIGALNVGRGIEEAICAMQFLPQCTLRIVGEGDLSQPLRALAREVNVGQQVIFHGYADPENISEILSRAHFGLNLLENKSKNYFYSLANKFFDYMHAGIPSINMNFPEYQAILSEYPCGLLLDDLKPDSITEAILTCLDDPQQWKNMSDQAVAAQDHFQWNEEAKKLVKIYDDLLG